jgi:hypothetical protein
MRIMITHSSIPSQTFIFDMCFGKLQNPIKTTRSINKGNVK